MWVNWQVVALYLLCIGAGTIALSILMGAKKAPKWANAYAPAIMQGGVNILISAAIVFALFCF